MTSNKTININSFDFLRFLLAFNILLGHLAELSQNNYLQELFGFANAKFSINSFFVISGFLVAKSYHNTNSIKDYFIKRARRILPAYLMVIILSTFILSLFSTLSITEYFINKSTWLYFFWNSLFLNFMHPCLPGVFGNNLICVVNGSLWTIKIEEGFYVILPLLFYVINKIRKPTLVLIVIYVLSIIYSFVLLNYYNKPILAKQLPGSMAYFSVGILMFLNFEKVNKYKYLLLIVSFSFLLFNRYLDLNLFFVSPFVFGIFVISCAYTLQWAKNFGKYGDFTYGIYIYHFPIIQITRHLDLYNKYNPYLVGLGVILVVFVFAFFSWHFVEKRFLDRYKPFSLT